MAHKTAETKYCELIVICNIRLKEDRKKLFRISTFIL